ncbi:MAG: type I DNA topoisomerase [Gemmatimonadetes bacterium]|nr:type I DNA topoisomerase [Gemmatimonadota bacterium]
MTKKKNLVIVESPTKAKTISKYLGKGYTVKATVGHIRDLPKRELGVDIDAGFVPKYVTIRGKGKMLTELRNAAKSSAVIFLATDPDREGEAIAWHVADQLGDNGNVHRVLLHEITKDAVAEAMGNPTRIDDNKVEAQQARRILDRLVGYKVSPLLWKSVKTGLSAGRVQTVALRLIVERESEIRKFKPKEYWSIEAELLAKKKQFEAKLHKVDGKKPQLHRKVEAKSVVDAIKGRPFAVTSVSRRERRRNPAAPFTTSTLQQEGSKQLRFSSARTMRIAQQLYEGVDLGTEGAVGLISYMRTDSTRVSPTALEAVRGYIGRNYEKGCLPKTPNTYPAKKSRVQDAHEAVRPTDVGQTPKSIKKHLTSDQFKLYQLIWQRFVASQMTPTVYDTTTIDFEIGRYLFRSTGSVVKFDGYRAVYQEAREKEEESTWDDLSPVPALEVGDEAKVEAITPHQHFTEPAPRFSEASLVKELEKQGIGRPSTYSSIISTLKGRMYVQLEDRRFHATDLGETVSRLMVGKFPNIFNVEFTSEMENELDKIEAGEQSWQQVLTNFYKPFKKALEGIDTDELIREIHDVEGIEKEPCPECSGTLTVKSGRFGPFIACSNYPDCKYTKKLGKEKQPDEPTDEICKECGSPMVKKMGRYGQFLACTKYPACKHTRSPSLGVKCPNCAKGDLIERRTRKGRSFFGCSSYPECDFSSWYRPVPDSCPECNYLGAESRSTKAQGEYRVCLKCKNKFTVESSAAYVASE